MERNRAWRRMKSESATIRRLAALPWRGDWWRWKESANGGFLSRRSCPQAHIGTKAERVMKQGGSDSRKRRCVKYSPNKSMKKRSYHWGRPGNMPGTREFDKRELRRTLLEYIGEIEKAAQIGGFLAFSISFG